MEANRTARQRHCKKRRRVESQRLGNDSKATAEQRRASKSSEGQRTAESRNGVAKIGNGKSMKRIERFRIGKAWQSEARAVSRRDAISNGMAKT